MKRIVILLVVLFSICGLSFAQRQDTEPQNRNPMTRTTENPQRTVSLNTTDDLSVRGDSATEIGGRNAVDSLIPVSDSAEQPVIYTDGLNPHPNKTDRALKENEFINIIPAPQVELPVSYRESSNLKDIYFYVMCVLLLFLGIFRISNRGYIFNLFSVYFNTSLKQNQLTERLIQARIPSFVLNLFFVIVSGTFAWLVIERFSIGLNVGPENVLFFSLAAVAVIYLIKFLFFRFFGWLSGFGETINRYLFIVFLINKIIGIVLIPFVILLLFGKAEWADTLITIGLLSVGFLLLSRYFRGYLLLKKGFVLTPFHFILFIITVEIIPLLLIYKAVADYL